MNFKSFSKTYRPIIETYLDKCLTFNISDNRKTLEDAIRYSCLANGKRIRPLLTIATHQLFQKDYTPILPIACAIELIHTYSLIHDDLPAMDNDDFRRGNPTCHKAFREDIAILAGDSLNTFAFELLATELPEWFSPKEILLIIKLFAEACGIHGMAGGQCLDLTQSANCQSEEELINIHKRKTGTLLECCFTLPAIIEGAPKREQDLLSDIGKKCGLLFQIVDDILDITGNKETLGKTPQKDVSQNKLTYVSLWGLDEAEKKANTLVTDIEGLLETLNTTSCTQLQDIIYFIRHRNQ